MNEQVNPIFNQPPPPTVGSSNFLANPKLRIILLVVVIVFIGGFLMFKSFTTSNSKTLKTLQGNQLQPMSVGPLGTAKLALIADKREFKVGENVSLIIRLFTGGYLSDGVDVVLKYDPKVLDATSSAILSNSSFQNFPTKSVDTQNGIVRISAISSATGDGFNGLVNFATINFKAKSAGSSNLTIDFKPGSTSESNVIKQIDATDILADVSNATIKVTNSGSIAKVQSCGARNYQSCFDSNGKAGSFWCTSIDDPQNCQVGCFKEQAGNELGCQIIEK